MRNQKCAYCPNPATTKDHVIPNCLYPPTDEYSRVQRIKVPACKSCNSSWCDDEAHFRNMITLAGTPSLAQNELWKKTTRSFQEADGHRRRTDILTQLQEVATETGTGHMIYPGKDRRVLRIVRKIVRGLAHYHRELTQVSDQRVWSNIMLYIVPPHFLSEMSLHHRCSDICEYRYAVINDSKNDIHSGWLITLLGRVQFVGIISHNEEGFKLIGNDG